MKRQHIAMAAALFVATAGCRGKSDREGPPLPQPVDAPRLLAWALPVSDGPELNAYEIVAAARDPRGALWFATKHTLNRFDPKTRSFANESFEDFIHKLIVDPEGIVWLGTDKGLLRFDSKTRASTAFTKSDGLPGDSVDAMLRDAEGGIWCYVSNSGASGGVGRFDPKTRVFTTFTEEKDHIPKYVSSMFQDAEGAMWLQASSWMLRVDPKTREVKQFPQGSSDGAVLPGATIAMAEDADGGLWFGTYHGAARRDPKTQQFTTFTLKDGLISKEIRAVAKDSEGAMWFGTDKGLSRLDPKTRAFTSLTRKDGLTDDDVRTLLVDAEGALWIGTDGGGLSRLDPKTRAFTSFTPRGDLAAWWAPGIAFDTDGAIWFGMDLSSGAARRLNPKTGAWTSFTSRDGLNQIDHKAVFLDGNGAIWLGGHRFDAKTGAFSRVLDSVKSAVVKDAGGGIWFETWDGVKHADLEEEEVDIYYKHDDGLAGSTVNAVAVDAAGGVWVGTNDGASRIDRKSKTVTTFKERDGLPEASITAAFVDKDSVVWLGTGKGLSRFDPKSRKFTSLTEQDGGPSSGVGTIFQDADGALWVSTKTGVGKVDLGSRTFTSYDEEDGLVRSAQVIAQAPDKSLWIGTYHGATRLVLDDPDEAGLVVTTRAQQPRLAGAGQTVAFTRPTGLSIVDISAPEAPQLAALPASPAGADITALAPGPAGAVWAGTSLSGVALRRAGKDLFATKAQGLPSMTITAVASLPGSNHSKVWVGTGGGPALVSLAGEALEVARVRWDDMPTGPVSALAAAEDGSAILAYDALPAKRFKDPKLAERRAKTRVLHVSAKGLLAEIPVGDALAGQAITALAYDGRRGVWAGTSQGLFLSAKGSDGKMTGFSRAALPMDKQPLSIRRIEIAPDAAGTLWMAVDKRGDIPPQIVGYRPETSWFYLLTRELGLPEGAAVDDIALDEAGYLVALVGSALARGQVFVVAR
jgi:ligand-binding sensor domain-containing protein